MILILILRLGFGVCGQHSKHAGDDGFWTRGCAGSTDLAELRRKHMLGPGKWCILVQISWCRKLILKNDIDIRNDIDIDIANDIDIGSQKWNDIDIDIGNWYWYWYGPQKTNDIDIDIGPKNSKMIWYCYWKMILEHPCKFI